MSAMVMATKWRNLSATSSNVPGQRPEQRAEDQPWISSDAMTAESIAKIERALRAMTEVLRATFGPDEPPGESDSQRPAPTDGHAMWEW